MAANYRLPNYTVYIDTSIAYSRKPAEAISNKLRDWIARAKQHTKIDVRVPEVVLEELTYQQFAIAEAAAANLKKNCQTLKDVCAAEIPAVITPEVLKDGARKMMAKSIDALSLSRISTPIERIDWTRVVSDSCWRNPPFEKPQSADDLAEKGFRDKIVLETIKIDAETISSGVLAFVCGDNRLRSSFEKQVIAKFPIEAYAGFDDFVGHLDLLAKTKSDDFAKTVATTAGGVFYDPNNFNSVAMQCGVITRLLGDYTEDMAQPPLFSLGPPKYRSKIETSMVPPPVWSSPASTAANWMQDYSRWTPASEIKLFVSPPVFQATKQDGRYHWISTVTMAQLLRKTEPQRGQGYALPDERIRTKDVDVAWSCRIDRSTAKFSDFSVDGFTPTMRDAFLNADLWSRSTYDFPMFPGADELGS